MRTVSHLLVADDALIPGHWGSHITLCGEEMRRPSTTDEHDDHDDDHYPDFRYCPACVREAARWSAEANDRASEVVDQVTRR